MPTNMNLNKSVKNSSAIVPLFTNDKVKSLTKESTNQELKNYFDGVFLMARSDNEYPINLDEVWMIAYSEKSKAVRALKTNFIEGIDYITFAQNGQTATGGYKVVTYMLSVSCLEYFIARKVRPVFEVYRQVFHRTAKKEITYTESEIKRHLLAANTAVENAKKELKEEQESVRQLRAQCDTLTEEYSKEVTFKMNLLTFISLHGLKEEWEKNWSPLL